jgi:hypothetical protein
MLVYNIIPLSLLAECTYSKRALFLRATPRVRVLLIGISRHRTALFPQQEAHDSVVVVGLDDPVSSR